ncbi:MAG TPA: MFS transporter [Aromatoleum sp.]|uniref:MFS transporter n=1 Tax=Aromatoleum sp. TaxID=2307007 RepID=UPI002B4A6B01|nr:MFS transporter [Aromatoleum sp.]HJV25009.1 MFS transporter [Aromatoleum sp.]
MTPAERRAGASLAAIFALRMLGLFLILPVFSLHAHKLPGGDDLALVGLAIGAYGLTQAFLQMPYGVASDRFGRKPVIVFGLVLFALGSVVAALAASIQVVIAGRVLQGAGAISAAVTALAADLTRDQHRTKIMAMIGSSIGLVFALSMVAAPVLYSLIGMSGIFWLTGVLALAAIGVVLYVVPAAPAVPRVNGGRFADVLRDGQLMRLNFGVFTLHLIQTAMWVLVPAALVAGGGLPLPEHWKVYLPAVLLSFALMVPAVIIAEKGGRMKTIFSMAVGLLVVVQAGLYAFGRSLPALALWLTLFFVAFNVLEAILPSWISRVAPPHAKGTALGLYNTLQSVGLFLGGAVGGWIAEHFGSGAVNLACGVLAVVWLVLAASMNPPVRRPVAGATAR